MANSPISDPSGDVSRLKQIEAQLRRMTKVFLDGADPIVIRDLEGNVLDANYETERVFGWRRDELLGAPTRHLLTPEYQELAEDTLARIQQGETLRNLEAAVRTKSGNIVPVLVTAFLLTEDSGEPIGYAQIIKDISQLKKVAELLQQRNRELQHFANILAHDLGAPLRTAKFFSTSLRENHDDTLSELGQTQLDHIVASVEQMDQLIQDLLNFSRIAREDLTFTPVDCHAVFDQAVKSLHSDIAQHEAKVTRDLLPTISGNRSQIAQLFQNLVGNAIKFQRLDSPEVHASARRCEDGWEFSIRDNGIGIAEEDVGKIFDIFRRLHGENEFPGTGVGLAICKAVVERHGGTLWVESKKNEGSVFRFTIPDQKT